MVVIYNVDWTSLFTIYWNRMQILYQNQLLNVPQWKLISDALTFLVELNSAACCELVHSKMKGYIFTFSGNFCIGEGINKSFYISSLLLNGSCCLTIKSPFLGMSNLIIKYVLRRYYFNLCSSSRTTRHCIIYKIALKYLRNNLRRPFENCEFTSLFYRITHFD